MRPPHIAVFCLDADDALRRLSTKTSVLNIDFPRSHSNRAAPNKVKSTRSADQPADSNAQEVLSRTGACTGARGARSRTRKRRRRRSLAVTCAHPATGKERLRGLLGPRGYPISAASRSMSWPRTWARGCRTAARPDRAPRRQDRQPSASISARKLQRGAARYSIDADSSRHAPSRATLASPRVLGEADRLTILRHRLLRPFQTCSSYTCR